HDGGHEFRVESGGGREFRDTDAGGFHVVCDRLHHFRNFTSGGKNVSGASRCGTWPRFGSRNSSAPGIVSAMCFACFGKSGPSLSPPITSVFTLIFAQS